jgi:flagellar P-ring protein precursor FlgI
MKKLLLLCIFVFMASDALAVRVKDMVEIQGVRENRLTGYGLVVGLNGTGDKAGSQFTIRSLANMLRNMGVTVNPEMLKVKNVAAVMVTANLPPFARSSQKLDCTISSVGDASSLAGGTLISTPLHGPDGKVYALAQGPISVGGFSVGGSSGSEAIKNFPTVGTLPGGAVVERSLELDLGNRLVLVMDNPDFTTAHRLVESINRRLGIEAARASDLSTVQVDVPQEYSGRTVEFIAMIESVDVSPDVRARVIVNERTGTVVMGSNVRISTVAIAHGSLSIEITEDPRVSQPAPFSRGVTTVTPQTGIRVEEGGQKLVMLPTGTSIGDLVSALNAIGVSPRDLVIILQSIKHTGALHADLEVI